MSEVDGWTVCRKIREESSLPIILLTARGEEYDKLFGFELGADDYLAKQAWCIGDKNHVKTSFYR